MSDENTSNLMALTNHLMNVKDSRWLQLEVCREFQRGQCSRTELECKFAHPPPHVEVQNGRVTACYDSIKGKCTRENPKCKYLHPPQHLKDQLLINGRNTLALKNLLMNQLSAPVAAPMGVNHLAMPSASALMPGLPTAYSPYAAYALNTAAVYPGLISSPEGLGAVGGVLPAGTAASPVSMAMAVQAQKVATSRADRVEVCREFLRGSCQRSESECKFAHPPASVERSADGTVVICMDFVRHAGACTHNPCRYFHAPQHLLPAAVKTVTAQQPRSNGADHSRVSPPNTNNAIFMPTATAASMPIASAASLAAAHAAAVNASQQYAQAMAAATAAAAAHHNNAVANSAAAALAAGKKRPLEPDIQASAGPNSAESFLLAAAALNTPANKRAAIEKSGIPMFQPVTHYASMGGALHYPQFATIPGLQTSYVPAMAFTAASALSPNAGRTMPLASAAMAPQLASLANGFLPNNAASVAYFDESGQLLDTLPVCRDFKQGRCDRPNCRYVHLIEDFVEVNDGKVTVCRDFAKGKCTRVMCKYYHVPVLPGSMLLNRLMSPTNSSNSNVSSSTMQPMTTAAALTQPAAAYMQPLSSSARFIGGGAALDLSSLFGGTVSMSPFSFSPQLPAATGIPYVDQQTAFIWAQQQQQQQQQVQQQHQAAAMYLASIQQQQQQQTASIGNGGS